MYNFLMGFPTEHAGSWLPHEWNNTKNLECQNRGCAQLPRIWRDMALAGASWEEMQEKECSKCQVERARRNRLVAAEDGRVLEEPFLSAPYVHQNNAPKYHAMLLRAVEHAKRGAGGPKHILWVRAQDTPHNPKEVATTPAKVDQKRDRFLQYHDQQTSGIPGLLPMYVGLKARVTEKIAKSSKITILKHTPCEVVGWDLHAGDRVREAGPERLLNYLPNIIYLRFKGAKWRVHPGLEPGVFPLKAVTRDWELNRETKTKIARKGFTLVPNFACTGFMMQGETLKAELADCGGVTGNPGLTEMITNYVILSRVPRADSLLLMRAFSPTLFTHGRPPGPYCLQKLLRSRFSSDEQTLPTKSHTMETQRETHEKVYNAEEAMREYKILSGEWDAKKKCNALQASNGNVLYADSVLTPKIILLAQTRLPTTKR